MQRVQLVLPVRRALWALPVPLEPLARPAQPVLLAQQAPLVPRVLWAPQVPLERPARLVPLAQQVPLVPKAL